MDYWGEECAADVFLCVGTFVPGGLTGRRHVHDEPFEKRDDVEEGKDVDHDEKASN